MRFIATADWQLGMTAHYLGDQARPRYLQARFDALRRIGEVAAEYDAEFIVACGDVFETNQLDRAVITRTFEALRQVPVPMWLLPGNHDPLDAASIYDDPAFTSRVPEQVHVLREPGVHAVAPGVELVAAPWSSKRPGRDLVGQVCADLDPTPPGTVRVLAGHGAVSSLSPDADDAAVIDQTALERVLNGDLAQVAVLGDRHSTTEVTPRIWYPGTPEVTDRSEVDPGNVLVIEVDPRTHEVRVERVHVGTWAFTVIEKPLNSDEDVTALEDRLAEVDAKDRTLVWLKLSGTLTMAENAHLERVLDDDRALFALLATWERHLDLAVIPDDHDFADLQVGGFVDDGVRELIGLAQDSARSAAAQGALRLLYRLARDTEGGAA